MSMGSAQNRCLIAFSTFRKYCNEKFKDCNYFYCDRLLTISSEWCINIPKDERCNESNCPVFKRLKYVIVPNRQKGQERFRNLK